ncbi:hypothetical protein RFI_26748 [Reticulomyxa filosa]|uniref:Scaffold protein Nfu/NifU N-terminal domain-containing protein n=1 Tax=Reticulomyxa filosa TaxID=46433 RepID=X6MAX9_RETFI|nr:hypothetical protein RFI_26748 [Reticulomyxa filosa]|eukprot:ETO10627.1 hypothetical protein RFI_26748 [Reticulomyxa filosa]
MYRIIPGRTGKFCKSLICYRHSRGFSQSLGLQFPRNKQFPRAKNNSSPSTSAYQQSRRGIFVQIEKTPNVLSLKFVPTGRQVLPEENVTLDISNKKDAMKKSPLAKEIFAINDGITNVFLTNTYVTVSVDDTSKWPDIQGSVVAVINDFLLSSKPVLEDGYNVKDDTGKYDDDDEVVAIIRELLDTRIRPNVQYDGGDVIFKSFNHETGTVYLEMSGACKGCASSQATLRDGIERMLKFYVPEVLKIELFLKFFKKLTVLKSFDTCMV